MYNFLDKTGLSYFWQLIKAKITKEQVGLGNVENKSSATIRSEITKENVTTALGYTPTESVSFTRSLTSGTKVGTLTINGVSVDLYCQTNTNTTTTTGASNTSSKIYLVGATSQSSAPTTYSHDTVYVGTDGHLYSNSKQAVNLSDSQALTNKTYNGYTLGAACEKGVDTTATSGSGNLITSGAMYTALSGKANYEVKLSADFNTMTTPGLYTMKSSSTNAPTNGSFHSLIVNKSDNGNYVQQIAIKKSTCDMYIRYLSSSTWSSWKQVAMSEAVQTAYNLANTANTKANIKKNPDATDGDIVDTHLTVGTRGTGDIGANSFTSGINNVASGIKSAILGGHDNTASGASTGILGGFLNTAVGEASIVLGGYENSTGSTSASNAVIVGSKNTTDGLRSAIIAGHDNKISCDGENSAVLGGMNNQATQQNSVVIGGNGNTASGNANSLVAGGYNNTASADNSVIVGGGDNTASGDRSAVVGGGGNTALAYQVKMGHYSKSGVAGTVSGTTGDAFIIGNGTSGSASNAFRVAYDGNCYAATAMNSTGADYAECFEWADGNPDNEDRIGFMTAFEGDKIRFANENDPVEIIGVVSALPAVVGDNYADEWCGKYLKDKYGRLITEHKAYEAETDENGNIIREAYEADEYVLNPDYNADEEYIPRLKRKEYSAVGTHGKLAVRDDGSCEVGGFCRSGNGGIATKSDSGFYVMERIDDETVRIYIK